MSFCFNPKISKTKSKSLLKINLSYLAFPNPVMGESTATPTYLDPLKFESSKINLYFIEFSLALVVSLL